MQFEDERRHFEFEDGKREVQIENGWRRDLNVEKMK